VTTGQGERLNRYLARRGFASRRSADALIGAGRVTVNGRPGAIGAVVDPEADSVAVDGRLVTPAAATVTLALNKPAGVVTTRRDPQRRPTVMDLVAAVPGLVPVGRLDTDSRGLLLLTTDGELAHRLTHPRYGVVKRYRVRADRPVSDAVLAALRRGAELDDGWARPHGVQRAGTERELDIVMGEGRKREVRRLCAAAGLGIADLARVAVGPVALGDLPEGASRPLTSREQRELRRAAGLQTDPQENGHRSGAPPAERVVTIDGPAGSGKSTLGERLSAELRLPFIDTGLFYRAVAVAAASAGLQAGDAGGIAALARGLRIEVIPAVDPPRNEVRIDGSPIAAAELHEPRHAAMLAAVSAQPRVRSLLLEPQRALARRGAVAVGRDCGTVVFPAAPVKLYLQAGEDVRVARRARQLARRGSSGLGDMSVEVGARDRADSSRAAAPLRPAPDAFVIDTETNGIEEMVRIALERCAAAGLVPP